MSPPASLVGRPSTSGCLYDQRDPDLRLRCLLPRKGVTEADLQSKNAKFGNPQIFVRLTEWCDKIITE